MRRKAVVSVLLSVVMILGSAFPAFAAGQMPSSEVSVGMESSVSDSLDDAETEQTGQDGGNIDAEQEPADAQEANEEAEAGTEEGSEEAGIEEEVSDEDSNNTEAETAEEDPTDERKTDTAEEEEEKPEALVGAEGERISVGDNVTAVFDSQTGRLSFYSYKGTLSNDWKNLIGNSDVGSICRTQRILVVCSVAAAIFRSWMSAILVYQI